MESEEKVLLRLTDLGGTSLIEYGCTDAKDCDLLGLLLYTVIDDHPELLQALAYYIAKFESDAEAKKRLREHITEDEIINQIFNFNFNDNGNDTEHSD